MSQQPQQEPLVGEVRFRVPLPLAIPLIALGIIALFAISFSRVFLSVESEAAVIIATATAANLLGAAAFVALRPRVSSTSYMELLAIVAYPILIGVVIASVGIGEGAAHGGEGDHGNGGAPAKPAAGGLEIVAENIAFDKDTLEFKADEESSLTFVNNDAGTDHNVAIYENQDDGIAKTNGLWVGDIFPGVETVVYDVPALKAGEYYFQCDVHPNMAGTAVVK